MITSIGGFFSRERGRLGGIISRERGRLGGIISRERGRLGGIISREHGRLGGIISRERGRLGDIFSRCRASFRACMVIIILNSTFSILNSQDTITVTYDEDDGLSQAHVTKMLQTADGFLWIATWNGLNRFDGYDFRRMVSQPGDGCSMSDDRLRDIWLSPDGNIYCMADAELFVFDTRSYRFHDIVDTAAKTRVMAMRNNQKGQGRTADGRPTLTDRQGLLWSAGHNGITCSRTVSRPATPLPQATNATTRCMARDKQGRIWIATIDEATVRLYDQQLNPIGYLTPGGRITKTYATWPAPVYCMTQTTTGTIWLGSKPGGLYRLTPTGNGQGDAYTVHHIGGLATPSVYDIKEDRFGRLWIATLGGGIACVEQPDSERPQLYDGVSLTTAKEAPRVRFIYMAPGDVLLAATTNGLLAAHIEKDVKNMHFRRHAKEANRPTSLGCNATMDIAADSQGRLYVSTESGGVLQLKADNLLADTLSFSRCPMTGGWPTDVALSITPLADSTMLIVSSNQLIGYNTRSHNGSVFDTWFFSQPCRFNEVRPVVTDNGTLLLPTLEGTRCLDRQQMKTDSFVPNIVLTAIAIQNGASNLAVNHLDTLRLAPHERSLTIHFAALDFAGAQRIKYAFRFEKSEEASATHHSPFTTHPSPNTWNNIGHDHSVTLLDLKPGTYQLWLHSTNSGGQWVDNHRCIVIEVKPTFWETPWAILLFAAIIAVIVAAIAYTLYYIRRIRRQRQELLEQYLALVEESDNSKEPDSREPDSQVISDGSQRQDDGMPAADEKQRGEDEELFMRRVVAFVEQNIDNADVSIGDMATACAVSRSGLQRKMKQLVGVTPVDFIRQARIKRACHLLRQTDTTVSDVAYRCGFSDPKYFSRTFKNATGMSPTDFKNQA